MHKMQKFVKEEVKKNKMKRMMIMKKTMHKMKKAIPKMLKKKIKKNKMKKMIMKQKTM